MYRSDLDTRDKGGAIAAVVAIHAALLFLLLQATGRIDLTDPQNPIRVFDVTEAPPPPPPEPVQQQEQRTERPREEEGAASPENIRSEATPIVDPEPRIELPLPVPMATTKTPNEGTEATQGAADVPGPGTGAGGTGTGTGSGGAGSGTGGGGAGDAITPPRLLTPTLTGRDFPRELIRAWPRGAQVFVRVRVNAQGGVSECIVDRGTGNAAIDSTVCNLVRQRFRYRPALNRAGQAVAGWHGYRQVPPR
ncbi:MAG: energy transducer TonB [Sphingomicrobium sp.]